MTTAELDNVIIRDIKVRATEIDLTTIIAYTVERQHDGGVEHLGVVDRAREQLFQRQFSASIFADQTEFPAHEAEGEAVQQLPRHQAVTRSAGGDVDVAVEDHVVP